MIGVPRYWRSTSLPANHVWANGDLVLFSDWPELKKVYDGGGFTGMLLAYNATSATIAANLGKWRPNAANPTGLYVPKLSDQFFRAWVQGGSVQAGAWQEDTVREVYGSMSGRNSWIYVEGKGALATTGSTDYFLAQISPGGDGVFSGFDFRLSRSIPTGPITAPPHVWQPVILYLGEKA